MGSANRFGLRVALGLGALTLAAIAHGCGLAPAVAGMGHADAGVSNTGTARPCFDIVGRDLDGGRDVLVNAGFTLDPHDSLECRNPELPLGETKNDCGGALNAGGTVCETWISADEKSECDVFWLNSAPTFCAATVVTR